VANPVKFLSASTQSDSTLLDPTMGWALVQPFQELGKVLRVALCLHGDAAVAHVFDPAGQVQCNRLIAGVIAKAHTLHSAVNLDSDGSHFPLVLPCSVVACCIV
jgi:hypothetical protein